MGKKKRQKLKRTIAFLVTELPSPSQKLVLGWPEKEKKETPHSFSLQKHLVPWQKFSTPVCQMSPVKSDFIEPQE